VPEWWEHPEYWGRAIPLFPADRYPVALRRWVEVKRAWETGDMSGLSEWESRALIEFKEEGGKLEEWGGGRPNPCLHMPQWDPEECTHYQMYENTSEGTPVSPVFATQHEVARWCADNGASVLGSFTATYEEWCQVCGVEPND
jgi:hypothetical protein